MSTKDIVLCVILPLILAELGPWCGWLAGRLLPWAATLRYGQGERANTRAEEWAGDLSNIPGQLSKLVYSLGQLAMGSVSVTRRKIGKTSRGVARILLSELVFPVTGALGQVLGTVLIHQLSRRRRKLEPAPTAKSAAGAGPGTDGGGVMLAGPQALKFHDACLSHALTLGLPPAEAALLADACLGAVNSRGPT